MVAVIHAGVSLRRAVNYNEEKVKRGVAELIEAGYYLKTEDQLSFKDKLVRLQNLMDLNERVKVNTLHISLNFAAEDAVDKEQLRQIAAAYLDRIGFAAQPYLLYEHRDVAHRHVHIVTTSIRPDGSSINLHNIGKIRSENARKALEIEFGLTPAEAHKKQLLSAQPIHVAKAEYGKSQTKQAIGSVLLRVIDGYQFTSLAELNAVLSVYGVRADPGLEGSRVRRYNGLNFHIIKEDGTRVGVPIKASSFHFKPTLENLKVRFERGVTGRQKHAVRLKNAIDFTTRGLAGGGLSQLADQLREQGIAVITRQSQTGQIYGLTYVDHRTRCVFNGSDLGKQYSAKALLQRLENAWPTSAEALQNRQQKLPVSPGFDRSTPAGFTESSGDYHPGRGLLQELLSPAGPGENVPWQLRKKRKKKKGKSI